MRHDETVMVDFDWQQWVSYVLVVHEVEGIWELIGR